MTTLAAIIAEREAPDTLADCPAFLTPRGQAVAATISLQRQLAALDDGDLAYVMPLVAELLGLDGRP